MRICKVSIHNLNSLRGQWEIDFQHPDYSSNGLFAICGPTGAGKTTILDAIALALYGRTPRLSAVNQGANEVMARGTGVCSAEVIFESDGTRYKAFWYQQRAHKKSTGKLQDTKPELARYRPEDNQWEILATKKTEFAQQVQSITGLSYDEFSRSMLLAQGNFATFLKAKKEERGAALEKITGTQIYSEISIRAQQRYSEHHRALEKAKDALQGVRIFTEEERNAHQAERTRIQSQLSDLERSLKQSNTHLRWRQDLDNAQKQLISTQERHARAQQTLQEVLAQHPKLEAAQRAALANDTHGEYKRAQKALAEGLEQVKRYEIELTDAQKEHTRLQEAANQATARASSAASAHKALTELLKEVRKLDQSIELAARELAQVKGEYDKACKELKSATDEKAQTAQDLGHVQLQLTELAPLVGSDHPEAALASQLSGWQAQLKRIESLESDVAKRQGEIQGLQATLTTTQQRASQFTQALEKAKNDRNNAQQICQAKSKEREQLLNGLTRAQCTQHLHDLANRQSKLESLSTLLADIDAHKQESEAKRAALAQASAQKELADQRVSLCEQTIQTLTDKLELVKQKLELKTLVEQFADARSQLADGTPCPLCGALEHPYCVQLPAVSVDVKEKKQLEADVRRHNAELDRARKALASAQGQIEALQKDLVALESKISTLESNRAQQLPTLALIDSPSLAQSVKDAQALLAQAIADEQARLHNVEAIDKLLEAAQNNEREALHRQDEVQTHLTQVQTEETQLRAKIDSLQSESQKSQQDLQSNLAELCQQFAAVDVEAQNSTDLRQGLAVLQQRATTFAANTKKLEELRGKEASFKQSVQALERTIQERVERQTAAQTRLSLATDALKATQSQRQTLFGQKDPQKEESASEAHSNQCQKALTDADKALSDKRTAVGTLQGKLQRTHDQNALLAQELERLTRSLHEQWHSAGFADEAAWKAASLTSEAIEQMARQETAAQTNAQNLSAALAEQQQALQGLSAQALSPLSAQELQDTCQRLEQDKTQASQALGAIEEKLKADDLARAQRQSALNEIGEKEKDLAVWAKLNALIGSADGKRYREFVQGITFEALLSYANESLHTISARYSLKPNPTEPLNINVIDHYQGDVERTSENLSGGESFIVSLSLALALSRMASKNVRIDSLFLDEGFGTLDPDALEAALSALGNLNAQGKLIGIISHVGEIRDRIPAHIEVIKASGGVSTLQGPGVSRL